MSELKVGEAVEGRVTNVLYQRVWVNIGAEKDATFYNQNNRTYSVGDLISKLVIASVNLERGHIGLQPPSPQERATEAARRKPAREAPAATPKAANVRRTSSAESKSERLRVAAAPKPDSGWGHEGGRSLPELMVGEAVEGRVTNVLYRRVWVNIGAEKDASFFSENKNYRVGDLVTKMVVSSVDLEKGLVQLQPPSP